MNRVLAVLALLVLSLPILAAPTEKELPAADRARLEKDKILVGRGDFWSVTTPYKMPGVPVFITSDSVLAAYHALLKDGSTMLAWSRGQALRSVLGSAHMKLGKVTERFEMEAETVRAATSRARVALATALLLLGRTPIEGPEVMKVAREEAARIEAAEGVRPPPAWYGPADPGFAAIDYGRFRPVGLLAQVPETARIARAVSWLAWLPFRIERDVELAAFLMIAAAAEDLPEHAVAFGGHDAILGASEDPCLVSAPKVPRRITAATLVRLRREMKATRGRPRVRDQATLPGSPGTIAARILPLAAPADAVLFQRLSDRQVADGEAGLPGALAVAASLGSAQARGRMSEGGRAVVAAFEGFADGKTLHDRYLRCLGLLLAPPPEAAPALFRSEAWRTKSLQTTLAGYTLWRHAWDLNIKDGSRYFGLKHVPPGFVEPAPAFFRTLRDIVADTGRLLEVAGGDMPSMGRALEIAMYEAAARVFARAGLFEGEGEEAVKTYWGGIWDEVLREPLLDRAGSGAYYDYLSQPIRRTLGSGRHGPRTEKERAACIAWLRERAAELEKAEPAADEGRKGVKPGERFERFAALLSTLADLAEKQLAGGSFSEDERKWIDGYGRALGRIMGEGDNPTDDAPVAVSVFSDPAGRRHLVEAVGRPRPLWILYPFDGGEVLCRGAVLTWYELHLPRPPTDEEWKAMLDAETPPERPEAVRGIEVR